MLSEQLKILVMMAYYNRPLMVRNALKSIVKANEFHQNWHFIFGDDGSSIPGRPIVEEILKDNLDKVTFIESNSTFEDKLKNGLLLGKYANEIMKDSDADVALVLCDDDELFPTYLMNLSKFFNENKDVLYCYSKVHVYNPLFQKSENVDNITGRYNQWNDQINPVGKLDVSQVAWRLDCCHKRNAWFGCSTKIIEDKPWVSDTDRSLFEQLHDKCGLCHPTNFVGQYKAVHDYQLLWHKNATTESLWSYDKMYRELAGVVF
jgi:hypothetical protein